MSRLRPHVKLTLRIYAGRDADLYRWLQELDALPYGRKAEVVKEVLRRGLRTGEERRELSVRTHIIFHSSATPFGARTCC